MHAYLMTLRKWSLTGRCLNEHRKGVAPREFVSIQPCALVASRLNPTLTQSVSANSGLKRPAVSAFPSMPFARRNSR